MIVSIADDITFPCKVHKAGSILTARNLADFKQMFGLAA